MSLSPSGRIAFTVEIAPGQGALYVANNDGSGLRQLASGASYYRRPRWSPDRRRIAISLSSLGAGPSGIFVIDVDGPEGTRRLAEGHDPAWSPDGAEIAFVRWGRDGGVFVMNADGSDVRQVTSPNDPARCSEGTSAGDFHPDWSR